MFFRLLIFAFILMTTSTFAQTPTIDTGVSQTLAKWRGANYKYIGTYPLRPGVDLMLLVRKDLADADAKEIYTIGSAP